MQKSKKKQNAKFVGVTIGRPHFEGMAKNQKGITLIALIITIIVMMILVGVTVSVALNGGLFKTASEATMETEKKVIYEQIVGAMKLKYNGEIDVKGTYEASKEALESKGKTVNLTNPTEITEETTIATFEVLGKNGTYGYKITTQEIKETAKNDFEINISRYNRGNAEQITIYPEIPDSWDPKYTEEEAIEVIAKMMKEGEMIDSSISITTLQDLSLALYNVFNDMEGEENPIYGEPDYDSFELLAAGLSSEMGIESPTDKEVMSYLLSILGAPYTTVEEWAQDVEGLEYEAQTKKLIINGKEIIEGVTWNDHSATYVIEETGTYEIQLQLDEKVSTEIIEITDIKYFEIATSQTQNKLVDITQSITLDISISVPSHWYNPNFIEEAKTKTIKVNGKEINWNEDNKTATYTTNKNGTYEIEVEIDGKKVNKNIEISTIDENRHIGKYVKYDSDADGSTDDEILYRVLYDENELGEGTGAQILADYILDDVTITLGYEDETIDRSSLEDVLSDGNLDCEHAYASVKNAPNKIANKYKEWFKNVKVDGITSTCRCPGTDKYAPYGIVNFYYDSVGTLESSAWLDGPRIVKYLGEDELAFWLPGYYCGYPNAPYYEEKYYVSTCYGYTSGAYNGSDFITVRPNSGMDRHEVRMR